MELWWCQSGCWFSNCKVFDILVIHIIEDNFPLVTNGEVLFNWLIWCFLTHWGDISLFSRCHQVFLCQGYALVDLARVVSCVNFQPFGSKSPMQVSFDYLSHAGSHKASLSGLWYLLGGGVNTRNSRRHHPPELLGTTQSQGLQAWILVVGLPKVVLIHERMVFEKMLSEIKIPMLGCFLYFHEFCSLLRK